jgi:hypothetical protein
MVGFQGILDSVKFLSIVVVWIPSPVKERHWPNTLRLKRGLLPPNLQKDVTAR